MTGLRRGRFARAPRSPHTAAVLAAFLIATLVPVFAAPAPVAAAACTGWGNSLKPPTTIRVLRTRGPAAGRVQTVRFRDYVEVVMPAEWGPQHPREALRAGAVAIKQYAWYHAMNWRGRSASGGCYDVVDSTKDQVYSPETKRPAPAHLSAVDATWGWSMRRSGNRFFAPGYRAGSRVACGADAGVGLLFQNSASNCARDGKSAMEILRTYYGISIRIVDEKGDPVVEGGGPSASPSPETPTGLVGSGDSTGDRRGDVIAVLDAADPVDAPDPASVEARIYASGQVPSVGTAPASVLEQPLTDTLARSAADLSGDGLEDLAVLLRSQDGSLRVEVALAVPGAALASPAIWWQGVPGDMGWSEGVPIRFVAGDIDGDGRADALILVGTADPGGIATLWWLRSTGTALEGAVPWWLGPVDVTAVELLAADLDADAHADIVIQADLAQTDPPGTGIRYSVILAAAVAHDGPASPAVPWADLADLAAVQARVTVADLDGDRRHDLVIARPLGSAGTQLVGLLSSGTGFTRRTLWQNSTSFRWSASRLAGADVNGDGRGDVVIMYNLGAGGSRFFRFISSGSALRAAGSTTDPTLPWAGTAIY